MNWLQVLVGFAMGILASWGRRYLASWGKRPPTTGGMLDVYELGINSDHDVTLRMRSSRGEATFILAPGYAAMLSNELLRAAARAAPKDQTRSLGGATSVEEITD